MKLLSRRLTLASVAAFFCVMTAIPAQAATFQEKKAAVLSYLTTLQKQHQSLQGVQVNEFEVYLDENSFDRLVKRGDKPPAVLGLELMGAISFPPYKDYVYDRAVRQAEKGGLVTLTWHERNPTTFCVRGEFFDCTQRQMTPETLNAVLTPGTTENKQWLADVDAIAKVLKGFKDRGILVLFRPYHEMNGGWFWWGKKDAYPQLWDALYEELSVRQGLDNLIWVWSADRAAPDAARYAPKKHKPDVVGSDVYEGDRDTPIFAQGKSNLAGVFKNTPFAITEVGLAPSEKVLEDVNPVWVLLWGGEYIDKTLVMKDPCATCNSAEQIDAFLKLKRFVSRDDMPAALRAILASGVTNTHPLKTDDAPTP